MNENELLCTITIERKPDGKRRYVADGHQRIIDDTLDDIQWFIAEFKKLKMTKPNAVKGRETG